MMSVSENLVAKLDGHNDFLTVFSVVLESSAWPILERDEPARIIMQTQNQYKIYAVDMAVTVAGHGECSRKFSRKT
jgi:hypothetical protein